MTPPVDRELVERLRLVASILQKRGLLDEAVVTVIEAADALEAAQAETERLRRAVAGHVRDTQRRMARETGLREALELIADPDYTHLGQLKAVALNALPPAAPSPDQSEALTAHPPLEQSDEGEPIMPLWSSQHVRERQAGSE